MLLRRVGGHTVSKFGSINFSQDFLSESSRHSSGQHDTPIVFDENRLGWKQEDDSSGQRNLENRSISEKHNYCRVSATEIQCESRE